MPLIHLEFESDATMMDLLRTIVSNSNPQTLQQIKEEIMAQNHNEIAALVAAQTQAFAAIGAALTNIAGDIDGLSTQATTLAQQVTTLQAQLAEAGNLSPEQAAALVSLQENAAALATTAQELAARTPDAPAAPVEG